MRGLLIGEVLMADTSKLTANFLMIYVKHNYNYEIVTGLKMKNSKFFRFIFLFDTWVSLIFNDFDIMHELHY